MSALAERKYTLSRVRAGDYLLPSNDLTTLWRICSYEEDGSAAWQDDAGKWHTVTGTHWQTAKYNRPIPTGELLDEDFLDWDRWDWWAMGFRTRAAAIKDALR